ncbi:aminotransferase class V-fold PLP-dependent enzyme [Aquimarina rhabdastrellae]
MLNNQKHLFDLPDNVTYLNGAYMAPQLKDCTEIGIQSVQRKCFPFTISPEDFFTERTLLKQRFATLIKASDYKNTAIIPSVSYGIANAAKNIPLQAGDEILVVDQQFPSNVYHWKEVAKQHGAIIKTISPPDTFTSRGKLWNEAILNSITQKTAVVAMPHIHWADGTLFDLKTIRKKTNQYQAALIIDGTQSVGALPFSATEIQPDALICGGYKWLLGPYSIGMAYYSDRFNEGTPIEHNWMNRLESENFSKLTQYQEHYQEKAGRYSVGESSNFVLTPMFIKALEQLIAWQPVQIQEYCKNISSEAVQTLRAKGCFIEDDNYRAHHLFGVYLPNTVNIDALKERFLDEQIYVSYRGDAIRISCNVYNTPEDFDHLLRCF